MQLNVVQDVLSSATPPLRLWATETFLQSSTKTSNCSSRLTPFFGEIFTDLQSCLRKRSLRTSQVSDPIAADDWLLPESGNMSNLSLKSFLSLNI